jgi:quinoprotein glucose dehydrogenase
MKRHLGIMKVRRLTIAFCLTASLAIAQKKTATHDWPIYGGTPNNNHYSPLSQINRENLKQLAIAWTYDTGEFSTASPPRKKFLP